MSPKPGVPQAALPCPSEATPPSPRQRQARTLRRSRQLAIPPRSSREMSSRRVLQTLGKLLAHARGSAPPGRVPVSPCPPLCVAEPTCHPEPALASNSALCSAGPRTRAHCGQLPGAGSSLPLGDVPPSGRVWGCSAQLVTKSALFPAPSGKS